MSGIGAKALRGLLYGVREILVGGRARPLRSRLNFVGGASVVDNPADDRTDVLVLGEGYEVVTKLSGATLAIHSVNLLSDNEDETPAFVLPNPATWAGQKIVAKRLGQTAASVTVTVAGGGLIDGGAEFVIVGTSVATEFWSSGTNVYVGPTTTYEPVPESESETPPPFSGRSYTFNPDNTAALTLVGAAIQAAADAGGGILSLTAPTTAKRPVRSNAPGDALNGRAIAKGSRAVATELSSASGSPTGDASCTVIAVVRLRDATTTTNDFDPIVMLGGGGANVGITRYGYDDGIDDGAVYLASGRGGNQFPYSTAWGGEPDGRDQRRIATTEWAIIGIRYNAATSRRELWINGEIHSSYLVADMTLTAAFGLWSIGGTTIDSDIAYAVFSSAVVPDSEMHGMHRWLAARFNLWLPARVTVLGDSLSQAQRPTPYALLAGGWVGQAQLEGRLSNAKMAIDYKNTAISGYKPADYTATNISLPGGGTITRLDLAAWRYNGMRRAGPRLGGNVAVVWLASNGPSTGETGANEWSKMRTILSTLRAAGFRTICATSIWRTDQNAEHVALDALIRIGSASWDLLLDLDQVVEFQSATASYTEDDGSGPAIDSVHLRRGVPDGQGIRTRSDGNGYGLIGWLFIEKIHEALELT